MNLKRISLDNGRYSLKSHCILGLVLTALAGPISAQEQTPVQNQPSTPAGGSQQVFAQPTAFTPHAGNWSRTTVYVDYSYVGGSQAKFDGVKPGDSAAQSVNASVAGAVPLNDKWFIPLGLNSANFLLDDVPDMPIPEQIHTLRLHTGLGYNINDQWTISGGLGPVLYRLDDIDSNDLGIAGMINALCHVRSNLLVSVGIGFNPDSDLPVLPGGGLRWNIRTNLTLDLMFPRTLLIYGVAPKLELFVGTDFKFAVFRTDRDLGDEIGNVRYNNALGTYRDVHLGAGLQYEIVRGLFLSIEGGYSVGRQIDYKRIDETVDFDPGPYAQAGIKYRF